MSDLRSCSNCLHNPLCWARVEVARTIQGWKFYAMTSSEQTNCQVTGNVDGIYKSVAAACTKWRDENED